MARKPIPHDGAVFCVADVINAYLAQTERNSAMKTRYTIDVDRYDGSAVMRIEEVRDSVAGEYAANLSVRLLRDVKVNFECGTSEVLSQPDNMGVRYPQKKANGDIYLSFGGWLSDVVPDQVAA